MRLHPSCFKSKYSLFSIRSSSSCLRLLLHHHLLVTSILFLSFLRRYTVKYSGERIASSVGRCSSDRSLRLLSLAVVHLLQHQSPLMLILSRSFWQISPTWCWCFFHTRINLHTAYCISEVSSLYKSPINQHLISQRLSVTCEDGGLAGRSLTWLATVWHMTNNLFHSWSLNPYLQYSPYVLNWMHCGWMRFYLSPSEATAWGILWKAGSWYRRVTLGHRHVARF